MKGSGRPVERSEVRDPCEPDSERRKGHFLAFSLWGIPGRG